MWTSAFTSCPSCLRLALEDCVITLLSGSGEVCTSRVHVNPAGEPGWYRLHPTHLQSLRDRLSLLVSEAGSWKAEYWPGIPSTEIFVQWNLTCPENFRVSPPSCFHLPKPKETTYRATTVPHSPAAWRRFVEISASRSQRLETTLAARRSGRGGAVVVAPPPAARRWPVGGLDRRTP